MSYLPPGHEPGGGYPPPQPPPPQPSGGESVAPSWGTSPGGGQYGGGHVAPMRPPAPPSSWYKPPVTSGPVPPSWWQQRYLPMLGQQPQQQPAPQQPTGQMPWNGQTQPGQQMIPLMQQPMPPIDNPHPIVGPGQPPTPGVPGNGPPPGPHVPNQPGGPPSGPPSPGQPPTRIPTPGGPSQGPPPPTSPHDNAPVPAYYGDPWSAEDAPPLQQNPGQIPTTTINGVPGYLPEYTTVQPGISPNYVSPGQAQTNYADMSWNPGGPSTSSVVSNIMAGLNPQFQMQDQALQEQLADAGIVGGSAPGAMAQLGMQQQTQAMGDIAPYVMQGFGMQQQADLANQNWMNQLSEFNAGAQNQNSQFNVNTGLQGQEFNAQTGVGAQEFGQNLFQGNQEFNANQIDQAGQFDVNNMLKQAMYNAGIWNTAQENAAQYGNTDWLAQLQANTALQEAGMGVTSGAFQPIFTQPAPVDFSGLASGLMGAQQGFTPNAAPPPPAPAYPGYA